MKKLFVVCCFIIFSKVVCLGQYSIDSIYNLRASSIIFGAFEYSNSYSFVGATTDWLATPNGNLNSSRSLYLSIDKLGNRIDTAQFNYFDSLVLQYYPPLTSFDVFSSGLFIDKFIYAFGSKFSINSINEGRNSFRVAKLDSLGVLQWDKFITLPNDSSIEPVTTYFMESENKIIALCEVHDEYYNYEYPMILEMDTSGNVTKSVRILNQGFTFLRNVSKDNNGNYYCGGFKWLVLPNGTPKTMKIDSVGNIVWDYNYTYQANSNRNTEMIQTKNNFLVSVISQGIASNRFLYHLQKMDLNGNLIWDTVFAYSRQLDNSVLYELHNTNIVGVCMVRDTIGNPPVGQRLTMWDSSGVEQWHRVFYTTGSYKRLYDLKPTSDGGFIMCGDHSGYFDPISGYTTNQAWVLKTDSLGLITSVNNITPSYIANASIRNPYPNPANSEINIEVFVPIEAKKAFLHLFDMSGKELQTIEIVKGISKNSISLQGMSSGNYLVALSVDDYAAGSKRIVKVE